MSTPNSNPSPFESNPEKPRTAPASSGVTPPAKPVQRPEAPQAARTASPTASSAGTPSSRPGATGPSASRPAPATSGATRPGTPSAGRPVQGQRPAAAGTARPGTAAQRPGTPNLVKPAPRAKVRRARLLISKVDPWSVLKMSFLLSVALGIVTVVAAIVLWTVLDLTGIFDQVNKLLGEVAGSESGGFDLKKIASLGQVASFATIIAVINVVLLTALSMLAAVLYNLSATLVGGIGVTLTDD
ncbi:DUF3566 domain-containing protein [Pseudarthrobacter sp. J1763]|uniref:DUF3566 domain-containing protein n=1 Tax=Pseudarthrobacter sp. J1763 TaxID=3420445 RepID=UPI003D285D53